MPQNPDQTPRPIPLADEPDGLEALIQHNVEHDPGFADVWSPYAHMIRLADERIRLNLTQRDVAERMGVSQPIVARMEAEPATVAFARILAYARAIGARIVVEPSDQAPAAPVTGRGRRLSASRAVASASTARAGS